MLGIQAEVLGIFKPLSMTILRETCIYINRDITENESSASPTLTIHTFQGLF